MLLEPRWRRLYEEAADAERTLGELKRLHKALARGGAAAVDYCSSAAACCVKLPVMGPGFIQAVRMLTSWRTANSHSGPRHIFRSEHTCTS